MNEAIKYKYVAKPDTWFKEGSEAFLEEYLFIDADDCKHGLFRGTYIVADSGYDKFWHNKGYKIGDEVQMTELCAYEEFNIETIYTEINVKFK